MPDQSSAATEHALIQEITAPLATMPDDPVSLAADVHFPVALRGYDRIAVDAYVKQTSQLVAELQATRSPEAAIRRALERVGEQISGILQRAHDTAEQITMQSRSEAEDRLEEARREAARITAAAEQRLKDLDAETDRIWAERRQIVEDTRELATQLLGLTDSAAERFPAAEDTGGVAEPPSEEHAGESEPQSEELAHEPEPQSEELAHEPEPQSEELAHEPEEPLHEPEPQSEAPAHESEPADRGRGPIEEEGKSDVDGESDITAVIPPVDPADGTEPRS